METDSSLPGILIEARSSDGLISNCQATGALPTTAGKFSPGCILNHTTLGAVYVNDGTTASPTWNDLDEGGFTGGTVPDATTFESTVTLAANPQFRAVVDGSNAVYALFETFPASGTYAFQFGGGTTVPTDATTGWSGAAIFTDGDATGVNRIWINTGTSASSAFRRIAVLDNSAAYTPSNDTTSRSFDADTVTTAELADVVATLIRDLGIA